MDWIKVTDKLPEEGQRVFYYFKKVGVHRGHYYTSEPYGSTFYGPNGWLTDDVTHWMPDEGQPLPEPPK